MTGRAPGGEPHERGGQGVRAGAAGGGASGLGAAAGLPSESASATRQIDAIIRETDGWRGRTLSQLRSSILRADPRVIEEVKWKKPSNPRGVPVWSHDGTICIGNVLKSAVRLTFPKGARIKDPTRLFNARLDSGAVRAIDVREGDLVDEAALRSLILDAVRLNAAGKARP